MTLDYTPLNKVRYAGQDYLTMRDRLLRRLRQKYGDQFNNFVKSDPGVLLVEIVSYATEQIAWYQNRRTSDAYLETSRTEAAVARLVKQIGYKMQPATPATVELDLTFSPALPGSGVLKTGFRFGGPGGMVYEVVGNHTLTPGMTSLSGVTVREGATRTLTFKSNGEANQQFYLPTLADTEYLADGSVRVWVDATEWVESTFLEFEDTEQFEVGYLDAPPVVTFGDGFAGKIPEADAAVKMQFVLHHGDLGNAAADTIQTALDTLTVAAQVIAVTATNPLKAGGGTPPETAEHAKILAPISFASRDAAITKEDYRAQVNGFSDALYGSVSKGVALTIRSAGNDSTVVAQHQAVLALTSDHASDAAGVQDAVEAGLSDAGDALDSIAASRALVQTDMDTVEAQRVTIVAAAEQIAGECASQNGLASQALNALTDLQAEIDGDANVGTMTGYVSAVSSLLARISGASSNALALTGTIQTAARTLEDLTAPDELDNIASQETELQAGLDAAASAVSPLSALAEVLDANVQAEMGTLMTYLSDLFDQDCKANVVQVPILTRDADGFLTGPSAGLIRRVNEYLDTRKEVTQMVVVVSGVSSLIAAEVEVTFRVTSGANPDEVRARIEAVIDEVLRTKDYEDRLDLGGPDGLYTLIESRVSGLQYLNVEIAGPVEYLDLKGNLVPTEGKIITKGSVTVSEVTG